MKDPLADFLNELEFVQAPPGPHRYALRTALPQLTIVSSQLTIVNPEPATRLRDSALLEERPEPPADRGEG